MLRQSVHSSAAPLPTCASTLLRSPAMERSTAVTWWPPTTFEYATAVPTRPWPSVAWRGGAGGQAGAENGVLTVMCGGDPEDYARAEPLITHFSRMRKLLGTAGAGQLAKMCNQIAIAGLVQGLAEAINFGMKAGLDMEAVVEVISKGAAGSWQMENRHKTMIAGKFDFGFAADWMRKDLGICLDESRRNGAPLPVTALVDQFYAEVQKLGGGRWDTSSLMSLLKD